MRLLSSFAINKYRSEHWIFSLGAVGTQKLEQKKRKPEGFLFLPIYKTMGSWEESALDPVK